MHPLDYYGLEATEHIDQELSELDYSELWDLTLCLALFALENPPSNEAYSPETYAWLEDLTRQQQCSLLKWIGDRIEIKLMQQS